MTSKIRPSELTKIINQTLFTYIVHSKTSCLLTPKNKIRSFNFVNQYCSSLKEIPIISYEYVKKLKHRSDVTLIDVREPQELQGSGQIPASINIPLGQVAEDLGQNVDNGTFKAKYGRDKPNTDTEIVFFCKSGKRSQIAAELARSLGYQNTKNYLGSWTEWAEKEGLPK